jgi:hypothetical protein
MSPWPVHNHCTQLFAGIRPLNGRSIDQWTAGTAKRLKVLRPCMYGLINERRVGGPDSTNSLCGAALLRDRAGLVAGVRPLRVISALGLNPFPRKKIARWVVKLISVTSNNSPAVDAALASPTRPARCRAERLFRPVCTRGCFLPKYPANGQPVCRAAVAAGIRLQRPPDSATPGTQRYNVGLHDGPRTSGCAPRHERPEHRRHLVVEAGGIMIVLRFRHKRSVDLPQTASVCNRVASPLGDAS